MLEMKIVKLSHVVVSLGVHEEGQETIYYTSETMQAKKRRIEEGIEQTKFTDWFVQFQTSTLKGLN